jgi:hypothetical protein
VQRNRGTTKMKITINVSSASAGSNSMLYRVIKNVCMHLMVAIQKVTSIDLI